MSAHYRVSLTEHTPTKAVVGNLLIDFEKEPGVLPTLCLEIDGQAYAGVVLRRATDEEAARLRNRLR